MAFRERGPVLQINFYNFNLGDAKAIVGVEQKSGRK